jgi:hypothetical protein
MFSYALAEFWGRKMPDIDFIRADIEYKRRQADRLRGEIRELQRSGISSPSVEAVLDQMLNKIDDLCAERDRLRGQPL